MKSYKHVGYANISTVTYVQQCSSLETMQQYLQNIEYYVQMLNFPILKKYI